jgi:UDP-N-acetylmuramate dehydrogenase
MPSWPAPNGVKLSAAWLMDHAGLHKGLEWGAAGLSSNHCLALINRGEATAQDLLELAAHARHTVGQKFGVRLVPEPVFVGFTQNVDKLLTSQG